MTDTDRHGAGPIEPRAAGSPDHHPAEATDRHAAGFMERDPAGHGGRAIEDAVRLAGVSHA